MRALVKRKDHHYIQKLENNGGSSDIELIRSTMGGLDMLNEGEYELAKFTDYMDSVEEKIKNINKNMSKLDVRHERIQLLKS